MKAIISKVAVMVAVLAAARCFADSEPPSQVPDKYDQPLGDFKQSQAKAGMEVTFISKSTRETLGVSTDGGAVVERVEKDGPADKAMLKERDVIISICGVMISSQKNFNYALNKAYSENCNAIPVTVIRGGTIEALTMRIPGPPRVEKPRESPTYHSTESQTSLSYWEDDRRWRLDHLTFGPLEIAGGAVSPLVGMVGGGILAFTVFADDSTLVALTAPAGVIVGTIIGTGFGCVKMAQGLFNTCTGGAFAKKPEPLKPLYDFAKNIIPVPDYH